MNDKKTIMVIGDHLAAPSGVGSQIRYFILEMLKTGKYRFVCLAGAVKWETYNPQKIKEFGDDVLIFPVDNYGNPEIVRSLIRTYRPDVLWFMTDPRFFVWLWQIENEIRPMIPMVYHHVWDNKPLPTYNRLFYKSTDVIVSISELTNDVVRSVSPETELYHIPHSVPPQVFKTWSDAEVKQFTQGAFSSISDFREKNFLFAKNKLLFFWNNRNAPRKKSGTLIWWFKEWLDKVGHDKACLIMHTDPKDPNGQDLVATIQELGLNNQQVVISDTRTYNPALSIEQMALFYQTADCTINISDAEGFGLGTLESLMCGTPIIVNMTGGLQEQVFDGTQYFGVGIKPKSRVVIGSQDTPWIYEDRVLQENFEDALTKMLNMTKEDRKELGKKGQEYVREKYNFEKMMKKWEQVLETTIEKHGSWNTRKNHQRWEMREI